MNGRLAAPSSQASLPTVRFVGALPGRYSFQTPGGRPGELEVYTCRTVSVSPAAVVVAANVQVPLGATVSLLFERVGFLKGAVSRHLMSGFEVDLGGGDAERGKLASKIVWLKQHHRRLATEKRRAQRWQPQVALSRFSLADGTEHDCFVIDVSTTGAGLSARVQPPIGTRLGLGQVPCTVTRHFDEGFGIAFDGVYSAAMLEQMISRRPEPEPGAP